MCTASPDVHGLRRVARTGEVGPRDDLRMDTDGALAVWEALDGGAAAPDLRPGDWPGVADPDALRAQLTDWLAQYANTGTRRTYAYALGLPIAWVDLILSLIHI